MRNKLTDAEFNAFTRLTAITKMDDGFDLYDNGDEDCGIDFDNGDELISLETVLEWVVDGIAYSPKHLGLTEEETTLISNVLLEFDLVDTEWVRLWRNAND